jgi:hypothetical protein
MWRSYRTIIKKTPGISVLAPSERLAAQACSSALRPTPSPDRRQGERVTTAEPPQHRGRRRPLLRPCIVFPAESRTPGRSAPRQHTCHSDRESPGRLFRRTLPPRRHCRLRSARTPMPQFSSSPLTPARSGTISLNCRGNSNAFLDQRSKAYRQHQAGRFIRTRRLRRAAAPRMLPPV